MLLFLLPPGTITGTSTQITVTCSTTDLSYVTLKASGGDSACPDEDSKTAIIRTVSRPKLSVVSAEDVPRCTDSNDAVVFEAVVKNTATNPTQSVSVSATWTGDTTCTVSPATVSAAGTCWNPQPRA